MDRAVKLLFGLAVLTCVPVAAARAECPSPDVLQEKIVAAAGEAAQLGTEVQLDPSTCEAFKAALPDKLSAAEKLIDEGERCLDASDPKSMPIIDYALQTKGALRQALSHC